ncbi:MAG: HU family DNA-binding protein [Myxococcota bacterium]|jgi:DNA-binding protein HU-beta|nr:HU family DNA-binding protein [Myxococcota bacterium]
MTKAELIEAIQAHTDASKKTTGEIIDAVFENVKKSIKDEGRFSYPGFGTFNTRERKSRTGRNPRTGAAINISASKTVAFKPAPAFKDNL